MLVLVEKEGISYDLLKIVTILAMTGFAQSLFNQQHPSLNKKMPSLIDEAIEKNYFEKVDIEAAHFLAKGSEQNTNLTLLLAYLFLAARSGHLCIEIKGKVNPPLKQLWGSESELEDLKIYEDLMIQAFIELPDSFFHQHPYLVKEDNLLYLQKNWICEKEILELFSTVEKEIPSLQIQKIKEEGLSSLQMQALEKCSERTLTFISGGPGVGKSYTASYIVKNFIKQHPKKRVAIVAPTGKAVANLQSYLSSLMTLEEMALIEAYTLHRLFLKKIPSFLPYDFILVDEASMVDAPFMALLFKYHKPNSRLVFLGDPHQLPPIGIGSIFSDLICHSLGHVELKECKRTEIKAILNCAEAVKGGDEKTFFQYLKENHSYYELGQKSELYAYVLKQLPTFKNNETLYQKLSAYSNFKILSPLRQGNFGTLQINHEIKTLLSTSSVHPIIATSNDYQLEIYNGDMGLLVHHKEILFYARNQLQSYYDASENVRRIPIALAPSYEYAYCLSIHKSQGSEYEKVLILVPPKSEVFGRELLYTAITRSKKHFDIFADRPTLSQLISNVNKRVSKLGLGKS